MNYKVTLSLPAGVTVVRISSPYNAVPGTTPGETVTCSGKTIGSSVTDQIIFELKAAHPGRFPFRAKLAPDVPDTNPAGNTAAVDVTVAAAQIAVSSFRAAPARPRAGRPYQATLLIARGGETVRPTRAACAAALAGAALRARPTLLAGGGRCTWLIPRGAAGKRLSGSIAATVDGATLTHRFSAAVASS